MSPYWRVGSWLASAPLRVCALFCRLCAVAVRGCGCVPLRVGDTQCGLIIPGAWCATDTPPGLCLVWGLPAAPRSVCSTRFRFDVSVVGFPFSVYLCTTIDAESLSAYMYCVILCGSVYRIPSSVHIRCLCVMFFLWACGLRRNTLAAARPFLLPGPDAHIGP